MADPKRPSPYDAPDLYDRLFDALDFDVPFWLETARNAPGPVLEAACGSGRILLRIRAEGIDADGFDASAAMIGRLRKKALEAGLVVRAEVADMKGFSMGRRYARILCVFNAFAHLETTDDQIRALVRCRQHLLPGGAFVVHMSYPGPSYWLEPEGPPVLEQEIPGEGGGLIQLWDRRTKDVVRQCQSSEVEIRELDAAGRRVSSRRYWTTQRWVYRFELELLFRAAGYSGWEFYGGFDRRPLQTADDQMVAWAFR